MKEDKVENLTEKSSHGGKRENSGREKGSKNKKTKEQEVIRQEFKDRVLKSMGELINSQMNLAKGCQFLFVIETYKYKDKSGKWKEERKKPKIVESQSVIEQYLAGELDEEDDEYYFMTTQKPDNRSLDSLIDRVFGKAMQSMDLTSGGESIIPLLNYVRNNNSDNQDTEDAEKDKGDTRGDISE